MQGYGPKTFGALNAERYDASYEEMMAAETRDSVETLAELAGGGRVLELAIGTGRVAIPLAKHCRSVHGVEASEAMVAKLHNKPGGRDISVAIGDMAEFRHRFTPIIRRYNYALSNVAHPTRIVHAVASKDVHGILNAG